MVVINFKNIETIRKIDVCNNYLFIQVTNCLYIYGLLQFEDNFI